jgi:hypothetical protein
MGRSKGLAPYAWIYKDPFDHERHRKWHLARAQANHRGEGWEITIEQWFELWPMEKWILRGRGSNDLCMVRIDRDRPFSVDNVKIVTRYWQVARDKKPHRKPESERQI